MHCVYCSVCEGGSGRGSVYRQGHGPLSLLNMSPLIAGHLGGSPRHGVLKRLPRSGQTYRVGGGAVGGWLTCEGHCVSGYSVD